MSASEPLPRHGKQGWMESHIEHAELAEVSQSEYLLIGDSICYQFNRYKDVWECLFFSPFPIFLFLSEDLRLLHILTIGI